MLGSAGCVSVAGGTALGSVPCVPSAGGVPRFVDGGFSPAAGGVSPPADGDVSAEGVFAGVCAGLLFPVSVAFDGESPESFVWESVSDFSSVSFSEGISSSGRSLRDVFSFS